MAKRKNNKAAFILGGIFLFMVSRPKGDESSPIEIKDMYSNWGLQRSTVSSYSTRNLNQIEQIVVHHSASPTHKADDFARWHVEQRGWPGIGYHFVIEKDGSIIMGNPLENVSYHTAGQNTKSVGIVLSGNFDNQEPTPQQMTSLTKLIQYLRAELPNQLEVYGHRDFKATACPGANLYPLLNNFKLGA